MAENGGMGSGTGGGTGTGGGAAIGKSAERSSIEIKDLLRKLHPERGNHKDRIRRLNKFRTYVMPNNGRTPEFFDDDIPLLFLGSATPAIYLDDDDHDVPINTFYGLLFACGMPSDNDVGSLKRSCRQAINLVKWLLLDYKDSNSTSSSTTPTMPNKFKLNTGLTPGNMGGGGGNNNHNNASIENVELNVFSKAFLSLPVDYYRHMRLDLHVTGDERGGSREDACKIIVFILMKHLSEDSEYTQYVIVEELLSTPQAQQAYDLWSARNVSVSVQEKIKKNSLIRQAEIANRQRQDAINARQGGPTNNNIGGGGQQLPGGGGPGGEQDYDNMMHEESENQNDDEDNNNNRKDDNDPHQLNKNSVDDDKDDDSYYDPDENDVMAAIRRRQKKARKEAELAAGGRKVSSKNTGQSKAAAAANAMFVATRWEDSQVSREQAARAASAARAGQHDTVRDSQDAAAEAAERLEEKFRLLGRDPLGILKFQDQYAQATGTANNNNNNNKNGGGGGNNNNNESGGSGKNNSNDSNVNEMIMDGGDYYDLRVIELKQAQYMEMALQELNEEIQKAESTGNDEFIKKAILQKESLEALVERLGGIEAMESINTALLNANKESTTTATGGGAKNGKNTTSASYLLLSQPNHQQNQSNYQKNNVVRASILPTNPKFDPILFLTLLHRKSSYSTLNQSLDRLSRKTENQAEQLQNLVRDNFPLFVRCAEGFEEFRRSSEQEVGLGVNERIETLEAIAESCAYQAKKSFKPLLDNTSEVRKVQSSLAVLNRVGPILQVPALMRQHIENRRYSQALKTYRRALVIDDSCNIELLKLVKKQAEECVRDARLDLERRITQDQNSSTVDDLLNGIRDLGELLELDVTIPEVSTTKANSNPDEKNKKNAGAKDQAALIQEQEQNGIYDIGSVVVQIRDHPPALACLLLQAAHFAVGTNNIIQNAEDTSQRIYAGETLTQVQSSDQATKAGGTSTTLKANVTTSSTSSLGATTAGSDKGKASGAGNQWKYDVLDARVISTTKAVDMARTWLPRLVRIGKAAREDEKRRAARISHRRRATRNQNGVDVLNQITAFEVFVNNIAPSLSKLVEHAAFCALGSNTRTGAKYVEMTYGQNAEEKLRTLLRSPLPPSQSTKVGKELADLVQLLAEGSIATDDLRPNNSMYKASPLEACQRLGDSAVVTIEKRRCIYAFDVCSRSCSNRASGSGKFDADALLECVRNLSEQLSRPEECSNEVEKGCELVIRRCCEGLAGYVRDRGDDARLLAVAECADVMTDRIDEVIREVSLLTKNSQQVRDTIQEDIMGLESAMFDEYLESIRIQVANSVKVGWLDKDITLNATTGGNNRTNSGETNGGGGGDDVTNQPPSFPAYLSASLLSIARCRAQVEQALGNRIRHPSALPSTKVEETKTQYQPPSALSKDTGSSSGRSRSNGGGTPYQHLAMATVADGVLEGICNEIMNRKLKLKVRQADRLANELEFLNNTLKKFVTGDETRTLLKTTLHMLCTKAGRSSASTAMLNNGNGGRDYHHDHDGPDGLAALEELERLGRVYVLCLGD